MTEKINHTHSQSLILNYFPKAKMIIISHLISTKKTSVSQKYIICYECNDIIFVSEIVNAIQKFMTKKAQTLIASKNIPYICVRVLLCFGSQSPKSGLVKLPFNASSCLFSKHTASYPFTEYNQTRISTHF